MWGNALLLMIGFGSLIFSLLVLVVGIIKLSIKI
ncbi:putative holin-like toxin [Staphylococcus americanisciuri]